MGHVPEHKHKDQELLLPKPMTQKKEGTSSMRYQDLAAGRVKPDLEDEETGKAAPSANSE